MVEVRTSLPVTVDLDVYAGDNWTQEFQFKKGGVNLDLSSATLEAWARPEHTGGAPVQLTVSVGTPATDGKVTLGPPATASDLAYGIYEYDLEITISGAVTTWVRGRLDVQREVSP